MADQPGSDIPPPDAEALSQSLADIARRSQRLAAEFLARQASGGGLGMANPSNIGGAFMEMTTRLMADPAKLANAQMALWQDYLDLWENTARRMMGEDAQPKATPEKDDRRFRDAAWGDNEVFSFIKQSYLLTSRWVRSTVRRRGRPGRRDRPQGRLLHPPVRRRPVAHQLRHDQPRGLARHHRQPRREPDQGHREPARRPGAGQGPARHPHDGPGRLRRRTQRRRQSGQGGVPQRPDGTDPIRAGHRERPPRPLLIIPPWINKYYILDLRENNSFVRWAVEQGHTVFVISWVNPDAALAGKTFEDYLTEGALTALDAVEKATGEKRINAIGYCIGGTLFAAMLAVMRRAATRASPRRLSSPPWSTSPTRANWRCLSTKTRSRRWRRA